MLAHAKTINSVVEDVFLRACAARWTSVAEKAPGLTGLLGAERGMGHVNQSQAAQSCSHLSTPTDKGARLDCSFVKAVSCL